MNNDKKTPEALLESHAKLRHDYLDLCESYVHELPVEQFCFGMLRLSSQLTFDCAPSLEAAAELIQVSIDEGFKLSNKMES